MFCDVLVPVAIVATSVVTMKPAFPESRVKEPDPRLLELNNIL